ncbi:hypothetical protein EZV62_005653 [Acer yangbiense]|uniref:NB-ARC domain-containing protein n=1 Tax=Acer yangbiense TaxID=1000413 RepID=A0A5C7INM7_9ROSI|nr:hypothetical protein EZV62_005653 [Acer yangbiense]
MIHQFTRLSGVISLKDLHIGNCKTVTTLIEGIEQDNKHLEELQIEGCHDPTFVFRGHPPASLKRLDVRNCEKLQCLLDTSPSCNLEDLYVQDCPSLTCVLSSIHQLVHLSIKKCSMLTNFLLPTVVTYLEIEECSELTTLILPRDQLPEKLGSLKISWCPKLESTVERFHNNTDLYEIWIVGCEKLKSIPDGLHTLSSLADIRISYCASLVSFPQGGHKLYETLEEVGLQNLTSLGNLSICGLPDILSFRVEEIRISLPPNLTQLYIGHFPNLKDLSSMGLEKLTSLQWLSIHNCPHLKSLPSLPSSLLEIYKKECPLLEKKK